MSSRLRLWLLLGVSVLFVVTGLVVAALGDWRLGLGNTIFFGLAAAVFAYQLRELSRFGGRRSCSRCGEAYRSRSPHSAAPSSRWWSSVRVCRQCSSVFNATNCCPGWASSPGVGGFEFVVGSGPTRTLVIRDAQHEYVLTEK